MSPVAMESGLHRKQRHRTRLIIDVVTNDGSPVPGTRLGLILAHASGALSGHSLETDIEGRALLESLSEDPPIWQLVTVQGSSDISGITRDIQRTVVEV